MSAGPTLLVLEDDMDLREAMVSSLEDEGYTVLAAANGAEGLRVLRSHHRPAVILLDLMMPIMDGWAFHAAVQKDRLFSQIPIIVLSAHGELKELSAAIHLRKPVTFDQLVGAVRAAISD